MPVREVYEELKRLGMSSEDANYYSGYYDWATLKEPEADSNSGGDVRPPDSGT